MALRASKAEPSDQPVTAAAQSAQVVVGEMRDQGLQPRVRTEEVLADVGTRFHTVLLELAIDRGVHLGNERAIGVAGEQIVPLATPDDLDHVPPRTPVQRFEFLDDLAIAAHRAVQPLQVAIDDEDQVVEPLPSGERQTGQALGLIHLTVADEAPHLRRAGVDDAPIVKVAVETGLVSGGEGTEAHRDGRELPEVAAPGVRVAGQTATADLTSEPVEVALIEAPFQKRAGVDPG